MAEKMKSEALRSVHESAQALHEMGAINTKAMREFDKSCKAIKHLSKAHSSELLVKKRR